MVDLSHLDIGHIGETAALEHYLRRGYEKMETNYWKPFGEIDVVVKKGDELVFIEVKSVSCRTFTGVPRDTANPAENIHHKKRQRLRKVIAAFLAEHPHLSTSWRFDVAVVRVNTRLRRSRVEVIPDVVL